MAISLVRALIYSGDSHGHSNSAAAESPFLGIAVSPDWEESRCVGTTYRDDGNLFHYGFL